MGKNFGMMIQIQEPKSTCEIVHINWVTALLPERDRRFNAFLVLVYRYSKTPITMSKVAAPDSWCCIWKLAWPQNGMSLDASSELGCNQDSNLH
ncbi:hypothetical protein O181_002148 [Austropuccinia psidii MF-1]|uniref:Uncharacterized protein n=1 Tax=Austropuccinia psidii MF-1 TaxID=1389203 RepID=A0A9Q3BC67_9BASI|nr:hypothetical protein [Austropuccinia psidii MF-1]